MRPRSETPFRPRSRRALLALGALSLATLPLAACGSTGGGDGGVRRATLIDYDAGLRFTLWSESVVEPAELYSKARAESDQSHKQKVEKPDFIGAVAQAMDQLGFDDFATDGPAPSSGADRWQKAIEIETVDGVRHVASYSNQDNEQRGAVLKMTLVYLDVFNSVQGYQRVDNTEGAGIFDRRPGQDGTP